MIDQLHVTSPFAQEQAQQGSDAKRVLRMVKNERMGGYVPSWEAEETNATDQIKRTLEMAQNGQDPSRTQSFDAALAYQQTQSATPSQDDAFGFGDLIDMANPLHHIPIVGHAYRAITGDEIKPIGQIVGGAAYGGVVGAAAGIINVVLEEETGKDLGEIAMAMAFDGKAPTFKHTQNSNNPEIVLDQAIDIAQSPQEIDLPASLLAFTPQMNHNNFRIEQVSAANGRTAGEMAKQIKQGLDDIAHRRDADMKAHLNDMQHEPISSFELSSMSDLY